MSLRLSQDQVILLHAVLIQRFGGAQGILNLNLLNSALAAPYQTFDGELLFPTIEEQAARLATGLIQNHPFLDGNKRIGIMVMLLTAEINGCIIEVDDEDLINLGFGIARGVISYKQTLEWLLQHKTG
jgi:death-on-curing protein